MRGKYLFFYEKIRNYALIINQLWQYLLMFLIIELIMLKDFRSLSFNNICIFAIVYLVFALFLYHPIRSSFINYGFKKSSLISNLLQNYLFVISVFSLVFLLYSFTSYLTTLHLFHPNIKGSQLKTMFWLYLFSGQILQLFGIIAPSSFHINCA